MIKRCVTSAVLAFALAACGGAGGGEGDTASADADADGDGKVSMEEAANKMAANKDAIRPDPGKYRGTTELVKLDIPDAPPEARDMLRAMLGGNEPQVTEFCLTKEESEKGFEEMAKKSQNDDCSFEKFDISSGKFDAVMTCAADDGSNAKITLNGNGTRTSSDMTMVMDAKGPDGQTMQMTLKTSQERIGDCDS